MNRTRELLRSHYRRGRSAVTGVLFERRLGVRTDACISLDRLGVDAPDRKGYMPSGWLYLRRVLRPGDVGPDDVLLDVGSGMGRVVLQAAIDYPFGRVRGIEVSSELHAVATDNIRRNAQRFGATEVELECGDAVATAVPDDVTVVYLFNPFEGAAFTTFVQRLLDSLDRRPRRVRFVYANPRLEGALLATGRARLVRESRGWRPTAAWSRSSSVRLYELS